MRTHLLIAIMFTALKTFGQENEVTLSPILLGVMDIRPSETFQPPVLIPVIPLTVGSYYAEVRYNYDFARTAGAYFGKTFLSKNGKHSFIPQVGVLTGDFDGGSWQFYYMFDTKYINVNFQNQYSVSFDDPRKHFYYNWSSVSFHVTDDLDLGVSAQFYTGFNGSFNDSGLFVALKRGSYSVTLMDFNFYDSSRHFLALAIQKTIRLNTKSL